MLDVESALFFMNPDCGREEWVRCLMAFKSSGGKLETALDWSSGGQSFNQRDFQATWHSISAKGGISSRTLFRMARDVGWKDTESASTYRELTPKPQTEARQVSPTTDYAKGIWKQACCNDSIVSSHIYAHSKKISHAAGAGRGQASGKLIGKNADCIIVPMRTVEGILTGVECINPAGQKQTFGSKGILLLGNDLDQQLTILVVEGWASGVAWLDMKNWNACAGISFGKSRLHRVAVELQRFYQHHIVVMGEEQDD